MDIQAIATTDFRFPRQTALYHGKVRDVYTLEDGLLVSVATDRISAFDVILPRTIPYKGQVLNQLAAHFLEATKDIADNWLIAVPDPNVSVGHKAEPFKVEMVVRGCLVGHAWREYQAGARQLCGQEMPEGLKEYDAFPSPIITPTTKADEGHDEDISEADILSSGLVSKQDWQQLKGLTLKLFARGQEMAKAQGLVLADTKYEFGKLDGQIILIDEIHTPDSSRYFYADSYHKYVDGGSDKPKNLSKEFVREWLMENGFSGQDGQELPTMTDDFVTQISDRYIELYEQLTGEAFTKVSSDDLLKRIQTNLTNYLETNLETN
ncbi:MAG: phosphoribosylaminoimidazolesuccinocarboxamide synthase [Patescibacteria group bacterium]